VDLAGTGVVVTQVSPVRSTVSSMRWCARKVAFVHYKPIGSEPRIARERRWPFSDGGAALVLLGQGAPSGGHLPPLFYASSDAGKRPSPPPGYGGQVLASVSRAGDKHARALVIPSLLELDMSSSVSYASSFCELSAPRSSCIPPPGPRLTKTSVLSA
jgi:hypothetical protein